MLDLVTLTTCVKLIRHYLVVAILMLHFSQLGLEVKELLETMSQAWEEQHRPSVDVRKSDPNVQKAIGPTLARWPFAHWEVGVLILISGHHLLSLPSFLFYFIFVLPRKSDGKLRQTRHQSIVAHALPVIEVDVWGGGGGGG